jgi:hypothetical protein
VLVFHSIGIRYPEMETTIRAVCTVQAPGAEETLPLSSAPSARTSQISRKLALLRRSGLFGDDTEGATVTRAITFDDLRAAYCLVHEVYARRGIIHPDPARLRLRIFEATPNMATFIAKVGGRVVAVLSLVGDTKEFGLPSDSVFKSELDELRARNFKLCEVTNQAIEESYRRSALETELMRCVTAHVFGAGYHRTIATVSPAHTGFYELLNFVEAGSVRSYSQAIDDPVVALSVSHEQYRECCSGTDDVRLFINRFMWSENPYLDRVAAWAEEARRYFLDPSLLHRLFVIESDFIGRCKESVLTHLRAMWGSALYDAVVDPSTHGNSPERRPRGQSRIDMSKAAERGPCNFAPGSSGRAKAPQKRTTTADVFIDGVSNNPPSIAHLATLRRLAPEA